MPRDENGSPIYVEKRVKPAGTGEADLPDYQWTGMEGVTPVYPPEPASEPEPEPVSSPPPLQRGPAGQENSRPINVRVKQGGGFNAWALIFIAIGILLLVMGFKGSLQNFITLFTPLSQSQINPPGPTGSPLTANLCPPGMHLVATTAGHKCVLN